MRRWPPGHSWRDALALLSWLLAMLAGLAASTPALAWGGYGHRTIAAIAADNIAPRTAVRIAVLLRAAPALDTPNCALRTLGDASVWPDCLYGERWRWAYTYPWHYQNVPVCAAFDVTTGCADGNCVTAQIERNRRILSERRGDPAAQLMALAFLVHLVGDVHQPLHVGENADLGGNAVKASYGIAPGRNLHSIWDTALTERAISSAAPALARRYTPAERALLGNGTVTDWARESWALSRGFVYPTAFGTLPCDRPEAKAITWNEAAIEASLPLIDRRIQQAGLRLAAMLDAALAPAAAR